MARQKGFTSIRLDTYHKNIRSQALIEKHGYRRIPGHIHFPDCDGPFFCYEKRIWGKGITSLEKRGKSVEKNHQISI